jgi:hypothetical protein
MYQKYEINKLTNQDMPCIKRVSDGACIPFDPANRDYTEYLEWLSEGNEPLPPDEPTLP